MLPHRFPFRLVDRHDAEHATAALTVSATWSRGGPLPGSLAVEIMAQASILLLSSSEEGDAPASAAFLAGLDGVEILRPLRPGQELAVTARLVGRFGRVLKVAGEVRDEDGPLASGNLLLALDAASA